MFSPNIFYLNYFSVLFMLIYLEFVFIHDIEYG